MAWTTPRTWATSEVVTAAMMNAHVRDNENYILTGRLGGAIKDTGGNYTTTTYNTWAALSTSRLRITFTPVSTKVLVCFSGQFVSGASNQQGYFSVSVDGASPDFLSSSGSLANGIDNLAQLAAVIAVTAAASHTFDLYWYIVASAGTATLRASGTNPTMFSVIEVG